jgi:uncharacterized protein (DUF486 family)
MAYEKSMNISIWISTAGRAYFIQNHTQGKTGVSAKQQNMTQNNILLVIAYNALFYIKDSMEWDLLPSTRSNTCFYQP